MLKRHGWVSLTALLLAGCAGLMPTPQAMLDYLPETFESKDTHTRRFEQPPGVTCEAGRRALLSQGYIISEARADYVRGRKLFQPQADRHVELEFRIVCAAEGPDKRITRAFANGVQDQYGMRKVKSSASLGVGGVGSVSLPVQGDNDTMIKIGSETVSDHKIYQRLFDLMAQHIDPHASLETQDATPAKDRAVAPATTLSTVPPAGGSPAIVHAQPLMVLVPLPAASAPVIVHSSVTGLAQLPVQAASAPASSPVDAAAPAPSAGSAAVPTAAP